MFTWVSLAPRTYFFLRVSGEVQIHVISFGFTKEELGVAYLCDTYLYTRGHRLGFMVNRDQVEAFRLWDRWGEEVIIDEGRMRQMVRAGRRRARIR